MANAVELFEAGFSATAKPQTPAQDDAIASLFWQQQDKQLDQLSAAEKLSAGFALTAYRRTIQQHVATAQAGGLGALPATVTVDELGLIQKLMARR